MLETIRELAGALWSVWELHDHATEGLSWREAGLADNKAARRLLERVPVCGRRLCDAGDHQPAAAWRSAVVPADRSRPVVPHEGYVSTLRSGKFRGSRLEPEHARCVDKLGLTIRWQAPSSSGC
jgi:hypothetical protein